MSINSTFSLWLEQKNTVDLLDFKILFYLSVWSLQTLVISETENEFSLETAKDIKDSRSRA